MNEVVHIPMFPLSLLPLPGELIPLHIFEPRYRQLLQDMETNDIQFGIYCTHELNEEQIGSVMRLESILKRYPGGEADIIVRCLNVFHLEKLYRKFRTKDYPGGDVVLINHEDESPGIELYQDFVQYQQKRNLSINHSSTYNVYQIANELNLDLFDRYKLINASVARKISFLSGHIKFQLHLIEQEEKSKDVFFLN